MTPGTYVGPPGGDPWTYYVLSHGAVVATHPDGRRRTLSADSPAAKAVDAAVQQTDLVALAPPKAEWQRDREAVRRAVAEKTSRNDLGDLAGSGVVKAEPAENLGESYSPLKGEPGHSVLNRDQFDDSESPLPLTGQGTGESYSPLKGEPGYSVLNRPPKESMPRSASPGETYHPLKGEPGYSVLNRDQFDDSESPLPLTGQGTGESALTAQDVPAPPPPAPPKPKSLMDRLNLMSEGGLAEGWSPVFPVTDANRGIGEWVEGHQNVARMEAQRAPLKRAADEARAREAAGWRAYDKDWAAVQESLAPKATVTATSKFPGDYPEAPRAVATAEDDDTPPVIRRTLSVNVADRDLPG